MLESRLAIRSSTESGGVGILNTGLLLVGALGFRSFRLMVVAGRWGESVVVGVVAYQFWAVAGEIFIFKDDSGNAVHGRVLGAGERSGTPNSIALILLSRPASEIGNHVLIDANCSLVRLSRKKDPGSRKQIPKAYTNSTRWTILPLRTITGYLKSRNREWFKHQM